MITLQICEREESQMPDDIESEPEGIEPNGHAGEAPYAPPAKSRGKLLLEACEGFDADFIAQLEDAASGQRALPPDTALYRVSKAVDLVSPCSSAPPPRR
jgi:hypothetical protein